ncbi:Phospho-N-acetylmuramoyl-pentapeptide-transferase [[Leptolyngbya] sp. PCC 7376]|uniref:phospho-N-acetylmuramoyl-pentapeptide- transferase n=1 Tax=[Leptolyngbya] sp. PCC 7376 TaxID=111781 RepID=UPI00029F3E17|nr:phospho-N-acetylmuramoyl-pentapeptide-transferase [[Leptolyngbya] sp. PCC 7376]AFY38971.1 Phospho-N-acetylmuramoyl-pentapeptide-transferase [[Leptolyngbya] sp. PCC 7376]
MDAKFSPANTIIKPTGNQLLGLLTALLIGLSFAVTTFDASAGIPLWILLMVSAAIASALGVWVVPLLQRLKTGQIIREEGPQAHLRKAGTPTMGGLIFLPVGIVAGLVFSGFNFEAIAVALVTAAYGLIGWVDDWQVLRLKSNKGISPKTKLVLQIAVAIAFCVWLAFTRPDLTTIEFFAGLSLPLGFIFWALAGFAMVAESNATNLTDGVDGLAGGTGAIALLGMGLLVLPEHPALTVFCACMSGACLGFIVHNRNPAKVFMGDTGSLALGGAIASVGILGGNVWGLFIISGIFCIEAISVIAQVSYYKATKDETGKGKRLLKMAPIHHHFELSGWAETQIVGTFYIISTLLVVLSFFIT